MATVSPRNTPTTRNEGEIKEFIRENRCVIGMWQQRLEYDNVMWMRSGKLGYRNFFARYFVTF